MTSPRTRLDEGTTEFERELLRSWEGEQPSDRARRNALALVGVGVGLAVSATASTAGASVGGVGAGAATASIAPKAAVASALAIGKWLFLGALVVGTASVAGI